jgi:hypothetical protein
MNRQARCALATLREVIMAYPIALWRSSALSACAGLILVALEPALPASAQERLPPVPPDKYDAAQKQAAEEFQARARRRFPDRSQFSYASPN